MDSLTAEDVVYLRRVVIACVVSEAIYKCALSYASSFLSCPPPTLDGASCKTYALKVVNVVHAALMGPAACYVLFGGVVLGTDGADGNLTRGVAAALAGDASSAPAMFSGGLGAGYANVLTPITVGFFVWDLWRVDAWAKTTVGERRLMIVHHVISILVWPVAARNNVAGPFLLHFEYTELSSPLLQFRWYAQTFRGRSSGADMAVSAAFAVAFLFVRTTNIHIVLHTLFYARPFDSALHPHVPNYIRILGTLTLGLPSLLNTVWTLQIFKMGYKMLFGKKKPPTKGQ